MARPAKLIPDLVAEMARTPAVADAVRTGFLAQRRDALRRVRGGRYVRPMAVRRVVAYAGGDELAASRDFYVEVLGMRVVMEDPVLDLQSPDEPAAEVIIGAQEMQDPQPSFGRRR